MSTPITPLSLTPTTAGFGFPEDKGKCPVSPTTTLLDENMKASHSSGVSPLGFSGGPRGVRAVQNSAGARRTSRSPSSARESETPAPPNEQDDAEERKNRMEELGIQLARHEEKRKTLKKLEKTLDDRLTSLDKREADCSNNAELRLQLRVRRQELKAKLTQLASGAGDLILREKQVCEAKERETILAAALAAKCEHILIAKAALDAEEATLCEAERIWLKEHITIEDDMNTRRAELLREKHGILQWDDRVKREERVSGEAASRVACSELLLATRMHEENMATAAEEATVRSVEEDLTFHLDTQRGVLSRVCESTAELTRETNHYHNTEAKLARNTEETKSDLQSVTKRCRVAKEAGAQLSSQIRETEARKANLSRHTDSIAAKIRANTELCILRDNLREEVALRSAAIKERLRTAENDISLGQERLSYTEREKAELEAWQLRLREEDLLLDTKLGRLKANTETLDTWMSAMHHREERIKSAEACHAISSKWQVPPALSKQASTSRSAALQSQFIVSLRMAHMNDSRVQRARNKKSEAKADTARLLADFTPSRFVAPGHSDVVEETPVHNDQDFIGAVGMKVLKETTLKETERCVTALSRRLRSVLLSVGSGADEGRLGAHDAHTLRMVCEREAELADEMLLLETLQDCPLNGGARMRAGHVELLAHTSVWWQQVCTSISNQTQSASEERHANLQQALQVIHSKMPALLQPHAAPANIANNRQITEALLAKTAPAPTGRPRMVR